MRSAWTRFGLCSSFWWRGLAVGLRADDVRLRSGIDSSASTRPSGRRMISSGMSTAVGSRGHAIPADRSAYGRFFALRDKSESNLAGDHRRGSGRRPALPPVPSPERSATCTPAFMDERRVDELGLRRRSTATSPGSTRSPTRRRSSVRIAALQREGATGLLAPMVSTDAKKSDAYIVYLNQGGISLPDESYYREAKFKPIREKLCGSRREDVRAGRHRRAEEPRPRG